MQRWQFLVGVLSLAALPTTASARRRSFRLYSKNDTPESRRFKLWIGVGVGGGLGLIAIGRVVFWVLNRLEENPAPNTMRLPPVAVPSPALAAIPVASTRKAAAAPPRFGKRTS